MNATFKIEKGIPRPKAGKRGDPKYPFEALEVGDSFFVPGQTTRNMGGTMSFAKKRSPEKRFAAATVTENGVTGVRIWRLA